MWYLDILWQYRHHLIAIMSFTHWHMQCTCQPLWYCFFCHSPCSWFMLCTCQPLLYCFFFVIVHVVGSCWSFSPKASIALNQRNRSSFCKIMLQVLKLCSDIVRYSYFNKKQILVGPIQKIIQCEMIKLENKKIEWRKN